MRKILTNPAYLSVGAALLVAAVLVTHRGRPVPDPDDAGVVFVYFASVCAKPGDPGDCRAIPVRERPAFDSMAACSAYADVQLQREHNPRLMASCMKQHEG